MTDIHVVADPHDAPVGWIYATSTGRSYLQSNAHMRLGAQEVLHARAGEAVSELLPKPNGLPPDLVVRACRNSEIASY